jgi:Rrf2 family protein
MVCSLSSVDVEGPLYHDSAKLTQAANCGKINSECGLGINRIGELDPMKVSAREQHGLRLMAGLALQYGNGPIPLSEVAQAGDMSVDYLEQIVPSLRDAGLLNSTRGARGGYELARTPADITVGQVLRALDGDILPIRCLAEEEVQPCAQMDVCTARTVWQTVYDRVSETLDSMTLADL